MLNVSREKGMLILVIKCLQSSEINSLPARPFPENISPYKRSQKSSHLILSLGKFSDTYNCHSIETTVKGIFCVLTGQSCFNGIKGTHTIIGYIILMLWLIAEYQVLNYLNSLLEC